MTAIINANLCIGCGVCTEICAQTFAMGDDQLAHVIAEPDKDNENCARQAAIDCPTDAISLH